MQKFIEINVRFIVCDKDVPNAITMHFKKVDGQGPVVQSIISLMS